MLLREQQSWAWAGGMGPFRQTRPCCICCCRHHRSPNGNTNNCIKLSSFYVGDKANQTCDPVLCAAAYETSRCVNSERTNIVTELYKVCGCTCGESIGPPSAEHPTTASSLIPAAKQKHCTL